MQDINKSSEIRSTSTPIHKKQLNYESPSIKKLG